MATEKEMMATMLASKRWEIRMLVLGYDQVHREDWGALDVESARVDGDAVDVVFVLKEKPAIKHRLRVSAPGGVRFHPERPDVFEVQSASRVTWNDREITLYPHSNAVMAG
jgi:hypothetical protein